VALKSFRQNHDLIFLETSRAKGSRMPIHYSDRSRNGPPKDPVSAAGEAEIQFGREICGDLASAESREWLVTNGLGGFASGTIAGDATRRYHGILFAALHPPVGRTQLVAAVDEIAHYAGADFSLATHQWASGVVDPQGFRLMERFHLDGMSPVWTYALADGLLEKRVWMQQGENTTYVQYTLVRASEPLSLSLKVLVNYRDFHATTQAGDWRMRIDPFEHGAVITAFDGARPFYLRCANASCEIHSEWYRGCFLPAERERGLDDHEDHLFAASFNAKLSVGESVMLSCSTEANALLDAESASATQANHHLKLFQYWREAHTADDREDSQHSVTLDDAPRWLWQLVLAADQFVVERTVPPIASDSLTPALPIETDGRSIIAGYHWFADWGRDTMIALPGLTLTTGRPEVARRILLAFARFADGGMLPNNFPDAGGSPEYNTVDAALWYFEAVRQYFSVTQDAVTLQKLFPVLAAMIEAHVRGTRYDIHVDPADGLLYAGGPGLQLTWMDAKIGDWVVTPRTGKPVEINALWINALETMKQFAAILVRPAQRYETLSTQATASFVRFWNGERHCCYDVIDAPGIGRDASLRPNQIFAVSLPFSPLIASQQKNVVELCARHLLTSHGLRSLAPGETGYRGHYGGDSRARDSVYHQGTVWGWLLGPMALAHFRVYGDRAAALRILEPLGRHIHAYGLGTVGEIFDGDAPFAPRGCIAQGWTVAELLRAWHQIVMQPAAAQ
jgi:predicted glycogen debranching enzyme